MEKAYFSKQNCNLIFEMVQKSLIKTHGVDISKDERYQTELIKIMRTVWSKKNTQIPPNTNPNDELRMLTQSAAKVANNYFADTLNTQINRNDNLNRELVKKNERQVVNNLSTRPMNSLNQPQNIQSDYNSLLKQREMKPLMQSVQTMQQNKNINFLDKNASNQSNDDVARRFSELQSSRLNEYENITANNSKTNNQQPAQNSFSHPSLGVSGFTQMGQQQTNGLNSQQPYFNQNNALSQQQNMFQSSFNDNNQSMGSILEQQFTGSQMTNVPTKNIAPMQYNPEIIQKQPSFNQGGMQINEYSQSGTLNMEGDSNVNLDDVLGGMNNSVNNLSNQFNSMEMSYNNSGLSSGFGNNFEQQFNNPVNNLNPTSMEKENSIEKLFPNTPYEQPTMAQPQNQYNAQSSNVSTDLEILRQTVSKQQSYIDSTTTKLDKLVDTFNKQDISRFYNTIIDIPRLIQLQKEQPLTIRTHNLIISSKDRNFANTEFDKYNFRVVFGAESDYNDATYSNNNNQSINNVDLNNKVYKSSGLLNPTVQQVLRNITSIKLVRVIIPKPRTEVYYPDPYYLVSVDEFNSNIISTKNFNDKIFCKVHYDKEVIFNNRSYLYYLNNDDDFTMFYASPLSKLDRISVKLLDSEGNSVKDTYNDIDYVITNGSGDTSLQFYNSSFVGDRILYENDRKHIIKTIGGSPNYNLQISKMHSNSPLTPSDKLIVNLSNQIEYIFEVKTTEPDPTNIVRPSLN